MQRFGKKGLFTAIKDQVSNRHFWLFYDLSEKKIINRKLEALKLIRCRPDEKRIEPDFDVYKIEVETPTIEELRQEDLQIISWMALC
ncbi:MAG: hypothetical protein C4291_06455 [Candidatus Dadabacteria bacterium]